jgi:hypothetical protein
MINIDVALPKNESKVHFVPPPPYEPVLLPVAMEEKMKEIEAKYLESEKLR